MLPFQRTFISSYPKATQDTQLPTTHATSKLGKGVEFKNGFVRAEKSNNRKN